MYEKIKLIFKNELEIDVKLKFWMKNIDKI